MAVQEAALAVWWFPVASELTGSSPWIHRVFPSGIILANPGKFQLFRPFNITIGSGQSASYGYYGSWMCPWQRPTLTMHLFSRVATLQPTVMSLCSCVWGKHIFSVEGSIQSLTDAKGGGLGACSQRAPTILNCRCMLAKQSLFLSAISVLLQVIWHRMQKVLIMLWCNYLLQRHWQFHCTQTCKYDAIGRCNPFKQLVDPMLKAFLWITECLMHSILILFVTTWLMLKSVWWMRFGIPSQLSSILSFYKEFKLHTVYWTLFWGFEADKTTTTQWSGGRVQVWVQVQVPAGHLAITLEGCSRRQSKV